MMMKIIVALLIVASFLISGAIADPAEHYSGECDIDIDIDEKTYIGIGEYKVVEPPSGGYNFVCSGQLVGESDYPEKAIVLKEKSPEISRHLVITPSGQFTWTMHSKGFVP